jgi:hypothetical protein
MNAVGVDPGDQRTATERWRSLPRRWRVVMVVVAGVVAFELGLSLVGGIAGNSPAGDQGSSTFGTSSSGIAAVAELLADHGHPVDRLIRPVADASIPPDSTLFVVDPVGWTRSDTVTVASLVAAGEHVVLVGRPPGDALLTAMFGAVDLPRWRSGPAGATTAVGSTSLVTGVTNVSSGTVGSLGPTGGTSPILVGDSGVFGVAARTGSSDPGSVLLASSTFMTNAALAEKDNAAFVLNLAGPPTRGVVFDEFDHGYGRTGTGFAGLPVWWRWGLGLALAAIVVWMVSAARRFGPVQPAVRPLIPARVEFADALAATLASLPVGQLDRAVEPLRTEARQLLCRRSGILTTADDDEVQRAGATAGVPDHVITGVLETTRSEGDALDLGAALAWLETHTGART